MKRLKIQFISVGVETPSQSEPETTAPVGTTVLVETTAPTETADTAGKTVIVYFSWSTSGNIEKWQPAFRSRQSATC